MNTRSLPLLLSAVFAGTICYIPAAFADTLKERQAKVSATVEKVRPAVVCIQSRTKMGMGSGSGVIVNATGLILTAAHVVDGAATGDDSKGEVAIVLPDGSEVKGKVLGRDLTRDSAMVQLLEKRDWPHAEPAPADSIEKGEWCIAMGHPGGFDIQRGAPVRVGRLWDNNTKAFFRSDCTVSGGDSGGPLFDLEGRVIGIHSNISMDVTENRHVPIGVFHDEWKRLEKGDVWGSAKRLLADSDDLRPKEQPKNKFTPPSGRKVPLPAPAGDDKPAGPAKGSAWLGVQLGNKDETVTVDGTAADSPAAKAGLTAGDVILKVNGKDVGNTGDVISRVQDSAPGDKLKFTVKRGDAEKELEVTLAARKE